MLLAYEAPPFFTAAPVLGRLEVSNRSADTSYE